MTQIVEATTTKGSNEMGPEHSIAENQAGSNGKWALGNDVFDKEKEFD